jgi:signal transduction histidine kinase
MALPNEAIEDFARKKRRILFERISIFGTIMGLFHFSQDLISGAKEAPYIDLLITVVLFLSYWLHRNGYQNAGRILALSFLNISFAVYACLVPAEVGIYLFYFPLIGISMAVFDSAEKKMRISFVLLSGILLISLFISDFDLIGPYEVEAPNVETFFFINLVSSAFILVVCISFVLMVNEESERRLHAMAEEIKIKNKNLEKTNAELDRFFYSTSHDLRSPLLSLKGLVTIAKSETEDEKMQKYLDMMTERADRLNLFISDIIDYSKNTRTEVVHSNVDLHKLVKTVKENVQFLEGAERIEFTEEISTREVFTDLNRLNVVLSNLISNAIKYHHPVKDNQWIKIKIFIRDSKLHLVVEDNGLGIKDENHSKIFDMFYRGTDHSKGSGLGLYIVRETVEKMNGSIRVESSEGEGSSFIVEIPVSGHGIV